MSNSKIQTISHKMKSVLPPPKKYMVMLLNDDFTPMDFVVEILVEIFHLPHTQAIATMLMVHETGYGVCGIYQKDIAETKCRQVLVKAEAEGYPLRCEVRPE